MSRTPAARSLVVLLWVLIAPLGAAAQQSTPLDQTEQEAIRALILQTIRENPEVLVETLLNFQEEAQAEAEAEQRANIARVSDLLLSDPNAGVLGNPDGKIVLIEFFDYNCPYCRSAAPILFELIEENPEMSQYAGILRSSTRRDQPLVSSVGPGSANVIYEPATRSSVYQGVLLINQLADSTSSVRLMKPQSAPRHARGSHAESPRYAKTTVSLR